MNHSWGTIQRLAGHRQRWRSSTAALYASWHDGKQWIMSEAGLQVFLKKFFFLNYTLPEEQAVSLSAALENALTTDWFFFCFYWLLFLWSTLGVQRQDWVEDQRWCTWRYRVISSWRYWGAEGETAFGIHSESRSLPSKLCSKWTCNICNNRI